MAQPSTSEAPTPHATISRARLLPFFGIALAVVAADQLTKSLIRGWLDRGESWPTRDGWLQLSHVENSGAAFGILQGAGTLLIIPALIGIVAVIAFLFVAPFGGRLYSVALALILGGATGNLIDRAARSTVTDFIDPKFYPAFNIADSAIVIAVVTLFLLSFLDQHADAEDAPQ
ncbi:MAG TPA: signal peptidase II [Dehalococcoidia bacterium]|nr:signal peptidase II [Dehalococcoidia bacterium]